MLILRGVEEKRRNELTLNARLGMQDKSTVAEGWLSGCLHIRYLALLRSAVSLESSQDQDVSC